MELAFYLDEHVENIKIRMREAMEEHIAQKRLEWIKENVRTQSASCDLGARGRKKVDNSTTISSFRDNFNIT
jgi:hypothetical protein